MKFRNETCLSCVLLAYGANCRSINDMSRQNSTSSIEYTLFQFSLIYFSDLFAINTALRNFISIQKSKYFKIIECFLRFLFINIHIFGYIWNQYRISNKMECLVFQNINFDFFRNFPGSKKSEIFFRPILVKNISFNAEYDVGEGYTVGFDLLRFYSSPNCDF